MENKEIESGLKRAAEPEDTFMSPKAGRMDLDETSPHFLSPIYKSPEIKFNSADMPPPKVPTPRRTLGNFPQGIRKGSPNVRGATSAQGFEEAKNSEVDAIGDWFSKDEFTSKTVHFNSPKSNRIVRQARRSSSSKSWSNSANALETISEECAALANAIPHDLGVPRQLISLFSGTIKCTANDILTPGKENDLHIGVRALSLDSPNSPRKLDFKRPLPLRDFNAGAQNKKARSNDTDLAPRPVLRPSNLRVGLSLTENFGLIAPCKIADPSADELAKKLMRSQSEPAVSAMLAVEQSEQDLLLIGDCSKRFLLPLSDDGKSSGLKQISGDTLTALLDGCYSDFVDNFDIIDCRYPYEFHGGHIKGAFNLHTQKQVFEKYLQFKLPKPLGCDSPTKRSILIFHCEFSSHRGPSMCRFIRGADRKCNEDSFPSLHYPEIYILQGGYKSFYENHREYCEPCLYMPMCDPEHTEELKLYRNKSRTDLHKANSSSQMRGLRNVACKKFVL